MAEVSAQPILEGLRKKKKNGEQGGVVSNVPWKAIWEAKSQRGGHASREPVHDLQGGRFQNPEVPENSNFTLQKEPEEALKKEGL